MYDDYLYQQRLKALAGIDPTLHPEKQELAFKKEPRKQPHLKDIICIDCDKPATIACNNKLDLCPACKSGRFKERDRQRKQKQRNKQKQKQE